MTIADAMRRYSKKSTKDLRAQWTKATGKDADGMTRDTLIKDLADRAANAPQEATTTEPAAEVPAEPVETPTQDEPEPPRETVFVPDEDQPPTDIEPVPEAAAEDTQMRSTKSKSKGRKPKAHRPPKPKAERKGKAKVAKAPKEPKPKKERSKPAGVPAVGESFTRTFKGKDYVVKVTESGFRFDGEDFPALTPIAMKITGAKSISGPAFFFGWKPKAK